MRLLQLYIGFCIIVMQSFVCKGQSDGSKHYKYASVELGKGVIVYSGIEKPDSLLSTCQNTAINFRFGWRKKQPDAYTTLYRYPYFGAELYLATYHNNNVGHVAALSYFFNIPLSLRQNKLMVAYSGSFGLSYQSTMFDQQTNFSDQFISTPLACSVYLGFNASYKISNRWKATAGVGFRHISNGSFRVPNLGLNTIPISVGLLYAFENEKFDLEKFEVTPYKNHNLLSVFFALGSKDYSYQNNNCLKATLGVYFLRQLSYKHRVGLGMDIFYSPGIEKRTKESPDFSNTFSYGMGPAIEWVLNKKIYVPLSIGFYFHRNEINDETTPYYLRGGFRFLITPHCFTGLTIKAHSYYSDYFEWTLGYTFHKDPNKY